MFCLGYGWTVSTANQICLGSDGLMVVNDGAEWGNYLPQEWERFDQCGNDMTQKLTYSDWVLEVANCLQYLMLMFLKLRF